MLKLRKTNLITLPVKLKLPTDNPNSFNEGTITVQMLVKSKDELAEYRESDMLDADYIDVLLKKVEGLGDEDGAPINDEAAINEVKKGQWSGFLQPAILQTYFEALGESRVKNSKPSRAR